MILNLFLIFFYFFLNRIINCFIYITWFCHNCLCIHSVEFSLYITVMHWACFVYTCLLQYCYQYSLYSLSTVYIVCFNEIFHSKNIVPSVTPLTPKHIHGATALPFINISLYITPCHMIHVSTKAASSSSFIHPITSIQAKLQKHQAFEAEVIAHSYVIEQLDDQGKVMIDARHFASDVIDARLIELHRLWELLLSKLREKGIKLLQAQKLVHYLREVEEVMYWIQDKVCYKFLFHVVVTKLR